MSTRWKPILLAALLVCAPVTEPRHASAQLVDTEVGTEGFNRGKFWDYMMCGASIAFATSTGAWVLAVIGCSKAIVEHCND
jgi:hypothetical protein